MSVARLPPADTAAALLVVLLWGLNFVAGKLALAELPPLLLTSIRFSAVALLLAPVFRPRLVQLPRLALLAMTLGVGHFALLFVGLRDADAGSAAVTVQLGVPFSVLLAWACFGDRPDRRSVIGMALAFAGVALLAGGLGRARLAPLALIAVSIFLWAVSNILIKRLGDIPPLVINAWASALAAPMVLALSLGFERGQWAAVTTAGWPAWAGVAFTALGSSVVAYTLWYRLLARHAVSLVVPFTLLGPVIGFVAGGLALGETVTRSKVVGGLLTVIGVAVIELRRKS